MLYLVATPIGNLEDITLRALNVLRECDYILCEDTRHSRRLLNHYEISKPLKSYHKFNEASRETALIEDLQKGLRIALISDAGTPCFSDPGQRLVARCVAEKLPVCPIPGACAALAALIASGFPTEPFQFVGFLPRKKGQLTKRLEAILEAPLTSICYETPHRICKVLEILHALSPEREIAIGREITKKFEEFIRGNPAELLLRCQTRPLKGELVLLVAEDKRS